MVGDKSVVERAFELARSGHFATVGDVIRRLKSERLDVMYVDGKGIWEALFWAALQRESMRLLDDLAARLNYSASLVSMIAAASARHFSPSASCPSIA